MSKQVMDKVDFEKEWLDICGYYSKTARGIVRFILEKTKKSKCEKECRVVVNLKTLERTLPFPINSLVIGKVLAKLEKNHILEIREKDYGFWRIVIRKDLMNEIKENYKSKKSYNMNGKRLIRA